MNKKINKWIKTFWYVGICWNYNFQVSHVCFVGIKAIFKFSVPVPHWYVITEIMYVQNNIRCSSIVCFSSIKFFFLFFLFFFFFFFLKIDLHQISYTNQFVFIRVYPINASGRPSPIAKIRVQLPFHQCTYKLNSTWPSFLSKVSLRKVFKKFGKKKKHKKIWKLKKKKKMEWCTELSKLHPQFIGNHTMQDKPTTWNNWKALPCIFSLCFALVLCSSPIRVHTTTRILPDWLVSN